MKRGFTLIELLVVISIIAVLSSIVMASVVSSRSKALDAQRRSTLQQLQSALEIYYVDHNSYPTTVDPNDPDLEPMRYSKADNGGNIDEWIPGLAPQYISTLPDDPTFNDASCYQGWGGTFYYVSDGKNYKIFDAVYPPYCTLFTSVASLSPTDPLFDPRRPYSAFAISSNNIIPESGCRDSNGNDLSLEELKKYPKCW